MPEPLDPLSSRFVIAGSVIGMVLAIIIIVVRHH
jgi:hypothetical protein